LGEKYGSEQSKIRSAKPVKEMELDELHTYMGLKETMHRFGILLIERPVSSLIPLLETEEQNREQGCGTE
jgi:hypothetical protein